MEKGMTMDELIAWCKAAGHVGAPEELAAPIVMEFDEEAFIQALFDVVKRRSKR